MALPHTAGPLPSILGALWAHVELEQVAQHCPWQKALECAFQGQRALEGLLHQVLEGQEKSSLIQVETHALLQHVAITLDEVMVTHGKQVAQQQETNTLLPQLLSQASTMEPAATAAPCGPWGTGLSACVVQRPGSLGKILCIQLLGTGSPVAQPPLLATLVLDWSAGLH